MKGEVIDNGLLGAPQFHNGYSIYGRTGYLLHMGHSQSPGLFQRRILDPGLDILGANFHLCQPSSLDRITNLVRW